MNEQKISRAKAPRNKSAPEPTPESGVHRVAAPTTERTDAAGREALEMLTTRVADTADGIESKLAKVRELVGNLFYRVHEAGVLGMSGVEEMAKDELLECIGKLIDLDGDVIALRTIILASGMSPPESIVLPAGRAHS